MSDTVALALIALTATVLSPFILSRIGIRERRIERAEDRADRAEVSARADAVATQAAHAAELLKDDNRKIARTLAATAAVTDEKLDTIHTLVNSNMTAAMENELVATEAQLAALLEVLALRRDAGQTPSKEAEAVIAATRAKIIELRVSVADRIRQQEELADRPVTAEELRESLKRAVDKPEQEIITDD